MGLCFLAGMRLSAIRAALMMTVLTLGKFVFRPADSCNSLGLACIIICLSFPFRQTTKGFVYSVLATLRSRNLFETHIRLSFKTF